MIYKELDNNKILKYSTFLWVDGNFLIRGIFTLVRTQMNYELTEHWSMIGHHVKNTVIIDLFQETSARFEKYSVSVRWNSLFFAGIEAI